MNVLTPAGGRSLDVSSLPLVAYRGLWDAFAGPGTLDAVRRSYRRGVPSLARVDQRGLPLGEVLDLAANPTINPKAQPVYLMLDQLPALSASSRRLSSPLRAIVTGDALDRPVPVLEWGSDGWTVVGRYVSHAAFLHGYRRGDFAIGTEGPQLVLFDSTNTVDDLEAGAESSGLGDESVVASLQLVAGSRVSLHRVSDMVELDQLDRQRSEAA